MLPTDLLVRAGTIRTLVDRLNNHGLVIPDEVTVAVAVDLAVVNYTPPEPDEILADIATTGAAGVEKMLAKAAAARLAVDSAGSIGLDARRRSAMRLQTAFYNHAEQFATDLAPTFTAAADEFTTAYRMIPAEWRRTTDNMTTDQFTAFVRCRELRVTLDDLADIGSTLVDPTGLANGILMNATEYACVASTLRAEQAATAADASAGSPLGRWAGLLDIEGTTLVWRTSLAEQRQYVGTLPVVEIRHVREGTGYVPREVEVVV
jgi:hypothetical protein